MRWGVSVADSLSEGPEAVAPEDLWPIAPLTVLCGTCGIVPATVTFGDGTPAMCDGDYLLYITPPIDAAHVNR